MKKRKGFAPVLGVLLILGIVAFAGYLLTSGGVPIGGIFPPAGIACSGFNDFSLNSVDYLSNDPELNKPAWVLTVSQNCQGSYAVGVIDNDRIYDPYTGEEAENDFEIRTDLNYEKCQYPIFRQHQDILAFDYTYEHWFGSAGWPAFEATCKAKPNFYAAKLQPVGWGWYDVFCFTTTNEAEGGTIGTPALIFESSIAVKSGGKQEITTITNAGGQQSARLGNIGTVNWMGNLVSGEQCPTGAGQAVAVIYEKGPKVWKTVDSNKLNQYYGVRNNMFNCLMNSQNKQAADVCIANHHDAKFQAKGEKKLISGAGAGTVAGGVDDGQINLELTKVIQFPVLKFRIDAAWIGIVTNVGNPRIEQAYTNPVQTGETGSITAVVRNIGTGDGAFELYADCQPPFNQQGTNQYLNLAPQQIGYAYIGINAACLETTNAFCTVYVFDRNNPNKKDNKLVSMQCQPIIICQEGQLRCNGKNIEICAVSGWEVKETCLEVCVETLTGPACQEQPDGGDGFVFPDIFGAIGKFFDDLFGGADPFGAIWAFIVKFVVAVIIVMVAVLLISIPLPFLRALMLSPYGILITLVLALLLAIMFSVPIGMIAANIFGVI